MSNKRLAATWSPAIPYRHEDNIMSSEFTNAKIFTPSYERTCDQCIEQLMTNEFQRIWWKEQEAWSEKFYENRNLPKRILCRGKTRSQTVQASNKIACAARCAKLQKQDKNKTGKKCSKD